MKIIINSFFAIRSIILAEIKIIKWVKGVQKSKCIHTYYKNIEKINIKKNI